MKTIIAGSRTIRDVKLVFSVIAKAPWMPTEVVSGTARGVDSIGELWAMSKSVPVKRMPADWDSYGKRAGFIRNAAMADYADALILVWDGSSRGSEHMFQLAMTKRLRIFMYNTSDGSSMNITNI